MALIGPAVFEGVYYSEIHVPQFRLEMTFYESELSQVKTSWIWVFYACSHFLQYDHFYIERYLLAHADKILFWLSCNDRFEHHYSIKLCICSQLYINSVFKYTKQCHSLLTTHRVFRNLLIQSLLTWKTWTRAIRS